MFREVDYVIMLSTSCLSLSFCNSSSNSTAGMTSDSLHTHAERLLNEPLLLQQLLQQFSLNAARFTPQSKERFVQRGAARCEALH